MKKTILILLVIFEFSFSTWAQKPNTNEIGKIYFFRFNGMDGPSDFGTRYTYKIFIDSKLVCKLNNNRYSIHEVSVGKHICSVQFDGKISKEETKKFEIVVEPGHNVYLYTYIQGGKYFGKTVLFNELTENEAKLYLENDKQMKEDPNCL